MFLKGFREAPSGKLINSSILEEALSNASAVFETGRRDEFDIRLETLSGELHLLIGLWDVFWIWRMNSQDALFSEKAVKACDGAGITALPELDPENDRTGMGVTSADIGNKLFFQGCMLIRMMVGPSGAVAQGFQEAVKASNPAVNILSIGFVFDGSLGNAILVSVAYEG